ncbi:MAG: S28 family serine protease [Kofleriaceae bacterium]
MRFLLVAAALAGWAGCGDNIEPAPPSVRDALAALPGVTVTEMDTETEGYTFFTLRFTQPVDHADPGGATFQQQVSLLHRDAMVPMIVQTSGYWDYYRDSPVELTRLLLANQISIEHRFFGDSRPAPADWTKCTIEQMAADQHAIITALRTVYGGAFVTTGGSKGGMTAIYHRRFYPDDVDGTVPYVAPISFGAPDPRYQPHLDAIGPAACRNQLRAVATELLANRRAMLELEATEEAQLGDLAYTRIPIPLAVESSVVNLEWAFWQYRGVNACDEVPMTTAGDGVMWNFLDDTSPVRDSADPSIAAFEAYYYQAYHQLGFPGSYTAYLDPYLQFSDEDYLTALPTELPAYDGGAAMNDIDDWVQTEGDGLAFVYGEWDPWTGGAFTLGAARDSMIAVELEGSHGARIGRLPGPSQAALLEKVRTWTGVTAFAARSQRERALPPQIREPRVIVEPRIPPAMRRRAVSSAP